ncbi:MAG: SpoIIE family protein phosphatase [Candidatus Hydrogenedentes bacterium]|nr:SpoIIE family protein phosphatase [Candidatus Hydrogenedentota bacterium]
MLQGFLVSEADGRRLPVVQTFVVGRNADCDLVVNDPSASRRHLEISQDRDVFEWKDLGSSNGTLLNGRPEVGGELRSGDLLLIGDVRLRFEVEEKPAPPVKEDSKRFQRTILDATAEAAAEPPSTQRSTELLEAVYAVANEIATNYDPCNLMDRILQTTMQAIDAQRGALFVAGEGNELRPCPECGKVHRIVEGRLVPAELGDIPMSSTVAARVLQHGESVLYKDVVHDSELDAAQSILALNLRSIICAPLRAKQGILGILYIDSDRPDKLYTHDDMLLVAAVGNSAGIALENAHMHQQMLEKQRIEQEISTAWIIQQGFLVKEWPSDDRRFEVYGETRPAKTVGGDFYDFVRPHPDLAGILIGDVSGKGVPAALTMAQLLAQFRLYARDSVSPTDVLRKLNADLVRQSQGGLFCSLCYVMLDLISGEVVAANAGHLPAICIGADGASFFAPASAPPLGIVLEGPWQDERLQMSPGETLLLYTDGIVEARSTVTVPSPGQPPAEYGEEGLYWACDRLSGAPPQAVVERINEDVRRFCAPLQPHDDCTMIALRYAGHV